jgi:hypothetical protein
MGHSVKMFLQLYSEWMEDYSTKEISFDTPRLDMSL